MASKRPFVLLAIFSMVLATLLAPTTAHASTETGFLFRGNGFASHVVAGAGDVDGQVGRVAHSWLACTNLVGERASNSSASAQVGDLVELGAATTLNKSLRKNGQVHSTSINEIASVDIGNDVTSLELSGLKTVARATWTGEDYATQKWVSLSDLSLVIAGVPVDLSVEAFLEGGVELPGIATITVGHEDGNTTDQGAWIRATALKVELLDSATIDVGRATASIDRLVSEPFGGFAFGVRAEALEGVATVGPIARQPLPCPGTFGGWRGTTVASVDAGVLEVDVVTSRVMGNPLANFDHEVARGTSDIAALSLLDGLVQVEALHTEAYLRKNADGSYERSGAGTTFASLTVDGEEYLPSDFVDGRLTVDGIADIQFKRFQGAKDGFGKAVIITGLVIELLDGSGATVEVGKVRLVIR